MNNDLWSAIGQIGDDLISAADEGSVKNYFKQNKRNRWMKYTSIAACFVLAVCMAVVLPSRIRYLRMTNNENAEITKDEAAEEVAPHEAELEIVCTNGKLVFSRIAVTPCVRAEMPSCDGTEKNVKVFDDKHDIISALFHAMDGKEATGAVELTPSYQLLLYGKYDDAPWHYLMEIGSDGTVRISNNGGLLCFIRISEEELQSILQTLND